MADGDITAVKVLYRQALGGGQTGSGAKKNDKILVVGEITATYVAAGIAVNKLGGANCFGVSNIDFVKIEPTVIEAAFPTAENLFHASYDHENQKIFLLEDCGQANPAVPSDADTITLRFICVGDDADAPELT
jgi:hypothetical protein